MWLVGFLDEVVKRLTTGILLAAIAGVPFDKLSAFDDCKGT
jgi:hypothetical protein